MSIRTILICICCVLLQACVPLSQEAPHGRTHPQATASPLTLDQVRSESISPTFEQIARRPSDFEGQLVEMRGKVVQVVSEDARHLVFRMNVTQVGTRWTDDVLVTHVGSLDERILKDDVVDVYGRADGLETYKTVVGTSRTIPRIEALYIVLTTEDTPTETISEETPTPTAVPEFQVQTQRIGPVWDRLHDSEYSVEITVHDVKWLSEDKYSEPRPGNVYVVAYLTVHNLGPDALRDLTLFDFQVKDSRGAIRQFLMLPSFFDSCQIEIVDLLPDGSITGCVSFEVPQEGSVALIYAPFRFEGLAPGRYISFDLRND